MTNDGSPLASHPRLSLRSLGTTSLALLSLAGSTMTQEFGLGDSLTGSLIGIRLVRSGDMDGDGDRDLVVASADRDKISWFENVDGQGAFTTEHTITSALGTALEVGDLDGDGDVDVIVGEVLGWLENDGSGGFGPLQLFSTGALGFDPIAADIDGDGDLDVVASLDPGALPDRLMWFENLDGLGSFGIPSYVGVPGAALAAGDLTGNGSLDLATSTVAGPWESTELAWHANTDGQGSFGPVTVVPGFDAPIQNVVITDFDQSGENDVVAAMANGTILDGVALYRGGAGGALAFPELLLSGYTERVAVEDADGDGDLDLYTNLSPGFAWSENVDGNGTIGVTRPLGGLFGDFVLADLDGDGDLDAASGNEQIDHGSLVWYRNVDGAGSYKNVDILAPLGVVHWVTAADLDGDGDPDIASANSEDGAAVWYRNENGAGSLSSERGIIGFAVGVSCVAPTDLDSDGDLDVVLTGQWDNRVAWYANDGLGNFALGQLISTTNELPLEVVTADMDADGDPDVVTTSSDGVAWNENLDGLGTMGANQQVHPFGWEQSSIAVADFDGDGAEDILSGDFTSLAWYENPSPQSGSWVTHPLGSPDPQSLVAADLDGNGAPDALAASLMHEGLFWRANTNGLGDMSTTLTIDASDRSLSVRAADMDSDGDLDVVSTPDEGFVWRENLGGAGVFGPARLAFATPQARRVEAADMDGDGDMDLVGALGNALEFIAPGQIAWFENPLCASATPALELTRLGSPPNPNALMPGATSGPVLSAVWDPFIDHTTFTPTAAIQDLLLVTVAPANLPTPSAGTLLCDLSGLLLVTASTAPGLPFQIPVPASCSFSGATICVQGASVAAGGQYAFTNALDVTLGTSN